MYGTVGLCICVGKQRLVSCARFYSSLEKSSEGNDPSGRQESKCKIYYLCRLTQSHYVVSVSLSVCQSVHHIHVLCQKK